MKIPDYVHTVDDFIKWLGGLHEDRRVELWAEQLRLQMETYIDHERMVGDLNRMIDNSGIDVADDASIEDGMTAIVERYEHVRNDFSEYFDHDIASADHAKVTTLIVSTAAAHEAFRAKVRAMLVATTALDATDGDDFALPLLSALLGVPLPS